MPEESELLSKTVYTFDGPHIAEAFQANRNIKRVAEKIEGIDLRHGVLITLTPKEISEENKQNPAVILFPGIRNHPTEVSQLAMELLTQQKCPSINILHFPYDKPLEMERFVNEIMALIDKHDTVVLGGLCLGSSLAVEIVNRLPDEKRAQIKGLFLISPTISNELKFMPPAAIRLLTFFKDKLPFTSAEALIQKIRNKVQQGTVERGTAVSDLIYRLPPQVLNNAAHILDLESTLTSVQSDGIINNGARIPNITITWVNQAKEYMYPQQITQITDRISSLSGKDSTLVISDMPGEHGDVNSRENARRYRTEVAQWYEAVVGTN